ncbi:MAG: S8 family serine peptidase [Methylosarcina sp.]
MKENPVNPYFAHQEIVLLLPWYVNKTLRDPELKAVEKHLKVCLICKREITTLQKVALAVNKADALESAAQASFSRLKSRLHQPDNSALANAYTKQSHFKKPAQLKWYQKLGLDYFKWPQPAAVMLSFLTLTLLVPLYYVVSPMQTSDFRTLSSSENPSFNRNEVKNELKVIFAEGLGQQQIRQVLDSIHGRVVNGPSPEGVYLIQLTPTSEAKTVLDALSSLRKNADVLFAEPAYALLSSSKSGGGHPE